MEEKGWVLVKLLMIITGILIFIYLITPRFQKDLFKVRDLTTQANLANLRAGLWEYYKDNRRWPSSLSELVPKYLDQMPLEYLSSVEGSAKVVNAESDAHFNSLRSPGAEGWIYGAYDEDKGAKFSRKVLPLSTTLSDKSGDTSSW